MNKIINTLEYIQKNGISGFIRECYHRVINNYYERHFNVDTEGMVLAEDLGFQDDESNFFSSLGYSHLFAMLNKLPVDKDNSTLVDFGCGKGRVIIASASYQYKKIIGVELSNLVDTAKNNIEKMKHRKTRNIELIQCDATKFTVPSDVNIIYFFNPFIGEILKNVTRNIYASYKNSPRKIYIIYFNNDHFDEIIADQDWLTKIEQSDHHPNISCGLYETNV